VAVRVYVVGAVGVTLNEVPVTRPTLGPRVRLAAPVTAQLRVLAWPEATLAGAAVKLAMTGGLPTATIVLAVMDPIMLVAVRV
jgi:hypothetical protein